jgi:beta-glucosidase-like glycosyl hydrolase
LPRWARDGHRFSLTIAVSAQATAFIDLPSGQHVTLAATWDPRRAELIGSLLAAECRRKDVDVLLAPTVNLQRSPFGGRNFEFFGEDPVLAAAMGGALVRGLQRGGVAATVKHFVANDSETERFTVDIRVAQRVPRELYLAPFESIVRQARPWAVMAAYNSVNGHTMTESPMLNGILKDEWGFDGLVVSDWRAARTIAAAQAGLDLVMPAPSGPWGPALVGAVRQGLVSEAAIDDKVLRLLRLAARVEALNHGACARVPEPDQAGELWTTERAREALSSTAAAGFVLARNEGSVLPLDPRSLRRVAVIGPNAVVPRTLGGGSATVFPPYRACPWTFDTYLSVPGGTDLTEAHMRPPQHSATASLEAGQSVHVVLEHHVGRLGHQTSFVLGGISFQLNIEEPDLPDDEELARAVRLAQAADVATGAPRNICPASTGDASTRIFVSSPARSFRGRVGSSARSKGPGSHLWWEQQLPVALGWLLPLP